MKGVPWTVDHDLTIADELAIGIGTAELSDSRLGERMLRLQAGSVERHAAPPSL